MIENHVEAMTSNGRGFPLLAGDFHVKNEDDMICHNSRSGVFLRGFVI